MEVVHPQLWIFDFDSSLWSCVQAADSGVGERGGRAEGGRGARGPGPPAVFGHTATRASHQHIVVVGGAMVGTALNSEVRQVLQERVSIDGGHVSLPWLLSSLPPYYHFTPVALFLDREGPLFSCGPWSVSIGVYSTIGVLPLFQTHLTSSSLRFVALE